MDEAQTAFEKQIREYVLRVYGTAEYQSCPFCQQGASVPAEIIATAERLVFCEECDSIWSNPDPIDNAHVKDFQTFVDTNGKVGLDWNRLRLKTT